MTTFRAILKIIPYLLMFCDCLDNIFQIHGHTIIFSPTHQTKMCLGSTGSSAIPYKLP